MDLEVVDYNDKCNRHGKYETDVILLLTDAKFSAPIIIW